MKGAVAFYLVRTPAGRLYRLDDSFTTATSPRSAAALRVVTRACKRNASIIRNKLDVAAYPRGFRFSISALIVGDLLLGPLQLR
jgi:hypothetical protein